MKLASWRRWPWYVWLLAAYPVVFLFAQNVGRVFAAEVGWALGAALIAASVVFGLAALALRRAAPAGTLAAILLLGFFTYGHVDNLLSGEDQQVVWLLPLYAALMVGGVALVIWQRRAPFFEAAAPYFNIMALALVLLALPPLVRFYYRGAVQPARASEDPSAGHPRVLNDAEHPDIYYIILDGYSANAHLLRDYGYDNSDFTGALEQRGFYVAYDSKTTYGVTLPSLAASLNMRYLDDADRSAAQESPSDEVYLRRLIADNLAAQELQARGYTYIFMLSGFATPSTTADLNIDFHPTGPVYYRGSGEAASHDASGFYQEHFYSILLETTLLRDYANSVEQAPVADEPYKFWQPQRALMTWDEAERIPAMPEATFTFVHIIKPHIPLVLDREGHILPYLPKDATREERAARFFDQLAFTSSRTLALIDSILANSSTPPIIILQGDHGSRLGSPESTDGRRTNFEILNAYYFPGRQCAGLAQDIIPINSFRVMFNCYFAGGYDLLPARYFAIPYDYDDLFYLVPVEIQDWEAERHITP